MIHLLNRYFIYLTCSGSIATFHFEKCNMRATCYTWQNFPYWHEYLAFFFKAITGIVSISQNSLPEHIAPVRVTRSSANVNAISFRQRKHKTTTYNRSFFHRTTRTWNSLP
jgi:hypothetical protein